MSVLAGSCPAVATPAASTRRSRLSSIFFQAEDGIRDLTVTGVQTCALPICPDVEGVPHGRPTGPDLLAGDATFGTVVVGATGVQWGPVVVVFRLGGYGFGNHAAPNTTSNAPIYIRSIPVPIRIWVLTWAPYSAWAPQR